ncbi:MAG: 2OG-Fe(II) oxygenase [Polaromonas sp.]|nr:2OG-Fe(II) oxygenase [Polaromonas sp.]
MNQQTAFVQLATPQVLAWLESQLARGCTRPSLYKSLLDAGWQAASASQMMRLTPEEMQAFGAAIAVSKQPTPSLESSSATVAVPSPLLDAAGGMVDAGDKWVEVIEQRHDPELMVFANLLSPAECEALIDAARPRLSRSLTVDIKTGGEELHPDRTSQGMFFARSENAVVQRIEARIAKLLRWPVQNGEGLQVLRYPPGAQYRPHYDYFNPAEPGTPAILLRGGQRVATLIIYLFEPEEGGATVFPDIGVQVAPRRGNAVFFSYAQAHPASRTLHGGEPVVTGEKWIATKWLREREFT